MTISYNSLMTYDRRKRWNRLPGKKKCWGQKVADRPVGNAAHAVTGRRRQMEDIAGVILTYRAIRLRRHVIGFVKNERCPYLADANVNSCQRLQLQKQRHLLFSVLECPAWHGGVVSGTLWSEDLLPAGMDRRTSLKVGYFFLGGGRGPGHSGQRQLRWISVWRLDFWGMAKRWRLKEPI